MATSDLSLALAYELDPVRSVRDVLDLGTDPWARLDRRDCAAFGSDPRVCTAPRSPIRMLTMRLLTKGSGSVPALGYFGLEPPFAAVEFEEQVGVDFRGPLELNP